MPVFLFTDIEGSTQKWEKHKDVMGKVLSRHDEILRSRIAEAGGSVVSHTGDGMLAVFEDGRDTHPLKAAVSMQRDLQHEDWEAVSEGAIPELRVRIGLHAGYAERIGDNYHGPVLNRAARVMAAGWGGQIVLTQQVANAAKLPKGADLVDHGMHMLKDLGEPVQLHGLVAAEFKLKKFPPLRSLTGIKHNLPVQLTSFVGRARELGEISKLLCDSACRLITLVGPGGMGKTRLGLQAAAENIEAFPDGAFFVPLASVSSPDYIVSAIADALKLPAYEQRKQGEQGEQGECLIAYLHNKRLLIILDNFEHLLAGAGIADDILKGASQAKVIATSRERLNLREEWLYDVHGLQDWRSGLEQIVSNEGAQLFIQSARRLEPKFSVSDENALSILRIVNLVEGMPLGVELAATWIRTLSCHEIAGEVERSRDFLATTMRDVPEKHRSLRAVFESSWALLREEEKQALKMLSVFRGGFSREGAERVAHASLGTLSGLMDKSLIRRNSSGRYEIHELLRQYSAEKLMESSEQETETRDRHFECYGDLLAPMKGWIEGERIREALDTMATEFDNILAGWHWGIERELAGQFEKYIYSMSYFLAGRCPSGQSWELFLGAARQFQKGKGEGSVPQKRVVGYLYCQLAYHHPDVSEEERGMHFNNGLELLREAGAKDLLAHNLNVISMFYEKSGQYDLAIQYAQEELKLSREIESRTEEGRALMALASAIGVSRIVPQNLQESRELFERALKIQESIGNKIEIGWILQDWGFVEYAHGNIEEYIGKHERAAAIFEPIDIYPSFTWSLIRIGWGFLKMGEHSRAESVLQKSMKIRREHNIGISPTLWALAVCLCSKGEYERAGQLFEERMELFSQRGEKREVAWTLLDMAEVANGSGNHKKAQRLIENALEIFKEAGSHHGEGWCELQLGEHARIARDLEESRRHCQMAMRIFSDIEKRDPSVRDRDDVLRGPGLYWIEDIWPFWTLRGGISRCKSLLAKLERDESKDHAGAKKTVRSRGKADRKSKAAARPRAKPKPQKR